MGTLRLDASSLFFQEIVDRYIGHKFKKYINTQKKDSINVCVHVTIIIQHRKKKNKKKDDPFLIFHDF